MLSSIQSLFGKKNDVATPVTESEVSVRSPDDIGSLEKLIKGGPVTFVLVHADWCGPCQGYKPIWSDLEKSPGRKANMAMVHHDMVEKSPTLKNAKIPGYPSVLKVHSNGHIEEYKGEENKKTNALPNIRDKEIMLNELKAPTPNTKILNLNIPQKVVTASESRPLNSRNSVPLNSSPTKRISLFNKMPIRNIIKPSVRPTVVGKSNQRPIVYKSLEKQYPASELTRRNLTNNALRVSNKLRPATRKIQSIGASVPPMKGGLYRALSAALMRAGPASVLFLGSQMLPRKTVRGSTLRRTRKSNTRSRKN